MVTETDEYGEYDVDAGSTTHTENRCNAVLKHTWSRYGERRYCGRLPESTFIDDGSAFCKVHKSRDSLRMRAKEIFDTGVHCKSAIHFFDKISPLKKLLLYGKFDELLAESIYEFDVDTFEVSLDFSDEDTKYLVAEYLDEDDQFILEVPTATQNGRQATYLFSAAAEVVTMLNVKSKITAAEMETETAVDSEALFGEDGHEGWAELTEKVEHHLNLSWSRLVRDHSELLELGGVGVEVAEESEGNKVAEVTYFDDPLDQEGITPEAQAIEDDEQIPINVD